MNEPATGCGSPCTLRRRAGFIAEKQKKAKKKSRALAAVERNEL